MGSRKITELIEKHFRRVACEYETRDKCDPNKSKDLRNDA